MLSVAFDHPLANHGPVSLEILGNDHIVVTGRGHIPEYWEDAYTPFATPSGRPVVHQLPVTNFDEVLMLISTGQAVHPIGHHATRYFARPDITYLPITDATAIRWAVIWRRDNDNPHIQSLAETLRDRGPLDKV